MPMVAGEPIPILYTQMVGTGVRVAKTVTVGRQGKTVGQPAHARKAKLGCVFTQTAWDKEGSPSAIRIPPPTPARSRPLNSLESESTCRPGSGAGAARKRRKRRLSWGMEPNGSGILPINIFPVRCRLSYHARRRLWDLARRLHPNDAVNQKAWITAHQRRLLEADYFERNTERITCLSAR
jgi:hypothetical protein